MRLRIGVEMLNGRNWKKISSVAFPDGSRTDIQCLHRWKKVLRPGLHKGPWTAEEDNVVVKMVTEVGVRNVKWSVIAAAVNGRLGKQVRERWYNHLDPTLNKGPWTAEEDAKLVRLQKQLGNRWVEIAKHMEGRSENGIKNRWNSAKRRRNGSANSKRQDGASARSRKKQKVKAAVGSRNSSKRIPQQADI